jgi:hypothetical protein
MTAGYEGLSVAQQARLDELMTANMGDWPESLKAAVRAERPGCGDALADTVGNWVKRGNA